MPSLWEIELNVRLEAVGNNPTEDQAERLLSWIVDNVPPAYLASVAEFAPQRISTDIFMRAGEMGF